MRFSLSNTLYETLQAIAASPELTGLMRQQMITITVKKIGSSNWAVYAAGEMVESNFRSRADAARAAAELSQSIGSSMVSVDAALSLEVL